MPSLSRNLRVPKPGTGFLLIRLIGGSLQVFSGLLMVAALIGFFIMLMNTGPTLLEAFQYTEQRMAGFVILGIFGYLSVFLVLGFIGTILFGLGFACRRWGTQPAASTPASSSAGVTHP